VAHPYLACSQGGYYQLPFLEIAAINIQEMDTQGKIRNESKSEDQVVYVVSQELVKVSYTRAHNPKSGAQPQ
jgi:hypothetical protein